MGAQPRKIPIPYRLDHRPLGTGAYAEVFPAEHKETGDRVALKRILTSHSSEPLARIRREITAQTHLAHPNIMPILDSDPEKGWYTMPIATGSLAKLRGEPSPDTLATILFSIASALEAAHRESHIHRDISPNNILLLPGGSAGVSRWVLADWGLVRRPLSSTSLPLTQTGQLLGTPGFTAPEVLEDPTQATNASDIYSLGCIASWYLTGKFSKTANPPLPEDPSTLHWRPLILKCTQHRPEERPESAAQFRKDLGKIFDHQTPPVRRADHMISKILKDPIEGMAELALLANAHLDNASLLLDKLARVPTRQVAAWTSMAPETAARLASKIAWHLIHSDWDDRDVDYAMTPLGFVQAVLVKLVEDHRLGLAHDLAADYFLADAHWANLAQRQRTLHWLAALDDESARAIAPALMPNQELIKYYRDPALHPISSVLRACLTS